MSNRSALASSGADVGDLKLRYAPTANPVESAVLSFRGQEWLRTGYLVPYAVKYAGHILLGISRGLYAYDAVNEQNVAAVAPSNIRAQVTFDYSNGRYYFFPDAAGTFQVRTKAALDSGASNGTGSLGMPVGQNITEMRGFFVIKTGVNAGRAFVSTNGNNGYKLLYNTGDMSGAWTDAGLGAMPGADPRIVMGKPDGSLLVVLADAIGTGYGVGNVKTSVNGGTVWAAQTCNLATNASVAEGQWSPTLNKFVVIGLSAGVMRFFTTADGFNLTQEAGALPNNTTGCATCFIADNGAATVVVGAASNLYRSTGGGAFASVATPRQLAAICAAGANFYAINASGGVELSTDNGSTWTVIGQVNGPTAGPLSGGYAHIKAANGNLFFSTLNGAARFTTQPLPSLTPDRVGAVSAVPAPSGQTNAATFVRIF